MVQIFFGNLDKSLRTIFMHHFAIFKFLTTAFSSLRFEFAVFPSDPKLYISNKLQAETFSITSTLIHIFEYLGVIPVCRISSGEFDTLLARKRINLLRLPQDPCQM